MPAVVLKERDNTNLESEKCCPLVADFYDGKSVLVTGAAGFLGTVLLEVLLRCCPGIVSVYILLREKKGVQPKERKQVIFKKEIFGMLTKKLPETLTKVRVVTGDISLPDLGMSAEDLEAVMKNVSVVFHCAAVIHFNKPLWFMVEQNVLGTENVIKLSRKLQKLDAIIYASTAYSNPTRTDEIEEKVYKLPFSSAKYLLEEIKTEEGRQQIESLFSNCTPRWPNTYTFSKCAAENLLAEEASDLPIAIVRPSIIAFTAKGPLPGYIEGGSGICDLAIGIGKGFIRVGYIDGEKVVHMVPVDVVANTMIISAWSLVNKKSKSPLVVNCSNPTPVTWGHWMKVLTKLMADEPLPNAFQTAEVHFTKNRLAYLVSTAFNHYAPALVIDLLLLVAGKKPKLTKLYRFYDTVVDHTCYFSLRDWRLKFDNLKTLSSQLKTEDSITFPVDMSGVTLESSIKSLTTGAPLYNWEKDPRGKKERLRIAHKRYMLTTSIKWVAILSFFLPVILVVLSF